MSEPEVTASILASIPNILQHILIDKTLIPSSQKSILISSNNLANHFINTKWGIRPSQRRRYKDLFSSVRKHCRVLFNHYVLRGRIEWTDKFGKHHFGTYRFDEVRGNLVVGFTIITPESEWILPSRSSDI